MIQITTTLTRQASGEMLLDCQVTSVTSRDPDELRAAEAARLLLQNGLPELLREQGFRITFAGGQ